MWLYPNTVSRSLTVKSIPTVRVSSCRECKKGICPKHQFGMMYEHYPGGNCQESISSMGGSHARISVLQVLEKAWRESEAAFFSKSCAWPKKSSPNLYSLKTLRPSGRAEAFESLPKLPNWGMICDGVLYPLQAWEPYTKEKGGFSWPTPLYHDYRKRGINSRQKGLVDLIERNLWPTPRARSAPDCPAERKRDSLSLECRVNISQSTAGKKLCPKWVSLLMGYPIGWTELKH